MSRGEGEKKTVQGSAHWWAEVFPRYWFCLKSSIFAGSSSGKIRLWLGGRECFLAPPTPTHLVCRS